jgi:hypothetical protein
MKPLSIIILIINLVFVNFKIYADELGDNVIVFNPSKKPNFVNKDGSIRYWECKGMVSQRFLDVVYGEISFISSKENIKKPAKELCLYSISEMNIQGEVFTQHNIDYFTDKNSMINCVVKDYCDNFRKVTIRNHKILNMPLRDYLLSNLETKKFINKCVKWNGELLINDSCINY